MSTLSEDNTFGCPNYDSAFQQTLKTVLNMQTEPTPELRRQIYLTVCILVRLSIASFVYAYGSVNTNSKPLLYILLVGSLSSCLFLMRGLETIQPTYWWSKRFQLAIAFSIFLLSTLALTGCSYIGFTSTSKRDVIFKGIGGLLYLSVFGGLYQSALTGFC